MSPLIGLALMLGLGVFCLKCATSASDAFNARRYNEAVLWALPVLLLGGLIGALLIWGDYSNN